jgi:serine/threonine protein kinase
LKTTFRAFRALSQRGKGGVYKAIDFNADPPRLCVLKEGRARGEVDWDGRDGYSRVRNEEVALRGLRAGGTKVPAVYSSFEVEGNYYLAIEFIEGRSLHSLLTERRRRLTVRQALKAAIEICELVRKIHAVGWVWRDCKPANLIVSSGGEIRPIDFEGACPTGRPDILGWGSMGFSPPLMEDNRAESSQSADVYAVGAIIYFMLTGHLLDHSRPVPLEDMRQKVSPAIREVVRGMIAPRPPERPHLQECVRRLGAALESIPSSRSQLPAPREFREARI